MTHSLKINERLQAYTFSFKYARQVNLSLFHVLVIERQEKGHFHHIRMAMPFTKTSQQ